IVSFMQLLDWVSQLTTTPIFQTVNRTTRFFDRACVTLDHAWYLLTLIRVNHKNDFVMTHCSSLRLVSLGGTRPGFSWRQGTLSVWPKVAYSTDLAGK